MNTSHSNHSKTRLTSKDRKQSMKRLGIMNNLQKNKDPPATLDEEKERIQSFIDSFFQNEANSNKFSDAEKRKFAKNFQRAFIEDQYGKNPELKKNKVPKLKALPAPPVLKKLEEKQPLQAILPSVHIEEKKQEKKEDESGLRFGNLNSYGNVFKNNFNFMTKNELDTDSVGVDSNYKFTDENDDFPSKKPNKFIDQNLYSMESDEK